MLRQILEEYIAGHREFRHSLGPLEIDNDAPRAAQQMTQAANLVATVSDVDAGLERIAAIEGIDGVMIVKNEHFGLAGRLPPLVKIGQDK